MILFESFEKITRKIIKVLIKWCSNKQEIPIPEKVNLSKPTFVKIMKKLID